MNISNIIHNSKEALNESLGSLSAMPDDAKEMVIELLKSKTVHSFISTQSTFESFGYTNLKQIEDRVKMYVKSSDKMVAAVLAKSSDGQFFAYTHNNVGMLGKFNKASTETDVFSYNNGKIVRRSKGYREFEKSIASVGTAWIVFADPGVHNLRQQRYATASNARKMKYTPDNNGITPFMRNAVKAANEKTAIIVDPAKRLTMADVKKIYAHIRKQKFIMYDGQLVEIHYANTRFAKELLDIIRNDFKITLVHTTDVDGYNPRDLVLDMKTMTMELTKERSKVVGV